MSYSIYLKCVCVARSEKRLEIRFVFGLLLLCSAWFRLRALGSGRLGLLNYDRLCWLFGLSVVV